MWIQCGEGAFAHPCSVPGKYMSDWARETLYPFFQAIDDTPISNYVSSSMTIVPFAGITHLLSLALLGGCVLMVDLRVLGFGVGSMSPAKLERTVHPMLVAAIIAVLLSGFVLFFGQVLRVYSSPPFWVKITTLVAAIVFTFTVRNRLLDEAKSPSALTKALGVAAVAAWVLIFLLLTNVKALVAALVVLAVLGFMVFRPAASSKGSPVLWRRLASAASIAMWLTVAVGGRWIAFH
jgi:hypothetical protein